MSFKLSLTFLHTLFNNNEEYENKPSKKTKKGIHEMIHIIQEVVKKVTFKRHLLELPLFWEFCDFFSECIQCIYFCLNFLKILQYGL